MVIVFLFDKMVNIFFVLFLFIVLFSKECKEVLIILMKDLIFIEVKIIYDLVLKFRIINLFVLDRSFIVRMILFDSFNLLVNSGINRSKFIFINVYFDDKRYLNYDFD